VSLSQLAIVVNLAVEDHLQRFVLVGDRLFAGGKIDNAQPAHADRAAVFDKKSVLIRAAVENPLVHPLKQWQTSRLARQIKSGNSAHEPGGCPFLGGARPFPPDRVSSLSSVEKEFFRIWQPAKLG